MIYAYIVDNTVASTYDKKYLPKDVEYKEIEGQWPCDLELKDGSIVIADNNKKEVEKQINLTLMKLKETDVQMPRALEDLIKNIKDYIIPQSQQDIINQKEDLRKKLSELKEAKL